MLLDHVGLVLMNGGYFPSGSWVISMGLVFRIIGRLSFPLYVFMLSEGLKHTKNKWKYILKLAIMFTAIFIIEAGMYYGNILKYYAKSQAFTDLLALALMVVFLDMKGPKKLLALLPVAFLIISYAASVSEHYAENNGMTSVWTQGFPEFMRCAYSIYGMFIMLGFYYSEKVMTFFLSKTVPIENSEQFMSKDQIRWVSNIFGSIIFLVVNIIFWSLSKLPIAIDYLNMPLQTYAIITVPLLLFYNGARGYDSKWFRWTTYLFYPVHLGLIGLIFGLIFG